MGTINQIKQLAEADTPLLFFQCVLPSGDTQYWCTHGIEFNGQTYAARVLQHNLFDLQLSADDAMDGISKLSLTLANADSVLSELNSVIGFKGSQLTVFFAFADLETSTITTESTILFRGLGSDPDQILEDSLRLSFTNKLSLQRIALPETRVHRLCPWAFPANLDQRTEAVSGGVSGPFSRFYRCGYSADIPGGRGSLNGPAAFTSCDHSRAQCLARGMFDTDAAGKQTRRFGGIEFVPSATLVRGHGDRAYHAAAVLDSAAKYNDAVPMVYGSGWLNAPVILGRNDGNLTHLEALLGTTEIETVMKVVVNDVEIPLGVSGVKMTSTGWYSLISAGGVQGDFNPEFTGTDGKPLGDPYGSLAVLAVVVPNTISNGKAMPKVEVLLRGMRVDQFLADGVFQGHAFSNNPAWVILDILRRCGWSTADLNLKSFASAASYCGELITTTDLNGNNQQIPRAQCNLILNKRKSAAEIVRGIRVSASLMLRYGAAGLLELVPETSIAQQQPAVPDGSNSLEVLNGGWPTYEFSDNSAASSGIVRDANGASTVRLSSRSIAETSNRLSLEFQDESNEYQQDSLSLVDSDDSSLIGYEISSQSTALGIPNYNQATRVLLRQLNKLTKGNLYAEFKTSFRALKVRPGDIIGLTYLKEGFSRTPFRVVKLSPSMNYRLVTILAQIHNDDWYSDNPAVLAGAGRQPRSQVSTPRPLLGTVLNSSGMTDFGIQENIQSRSDGSATDILTIMFSPPSRPNPNSTNLPLLSLAPAISATGGTLTGNRNLYYAVSAVDQEGNEGQLSFSVLASIQTGTDSNGVTLTKLSFPAKAVSFNVYRGDNPQVLYRIAANNILQSSFTDSGLSIQAIAPPDSNFNHANFYYRLEYAGPFTATVVGVSVIGNSDMGATNLANSGFLVRIIQGTGKGQERQIASNDTTTITITSPWSVVPDSSSVFVIAETGWKLAAVSSASPVQFEVPYSQGTVVQISGRAANVANLEGVLDLCPLTRWSLGGTHANFDVAPAPGFTLSAPGRGDLEVTQVGFQTLTNTETISAGTLQTIYWNEIDTPSTYTLANPIDTAALSISLNSAGSPQLGDIIQIGAELMTVLTVNSGANTYNVLRQSLGSSATVHNAGDFVLHLQKKSFILPFARDFFENRASLNYLHSVELRDVRVAAAQFFVTNACGDSQTTSQCYTAVPNGGQLTSSGGLRTLSGGQLNLQVSGYLAVQQNAAPPLLVEASHAVRDIRATVGQAPGLTAINMTIMQNGTPYCSLAIQPGNVTSDVQSGVELPPVEEGATLTLAITQVGQAWASSPGRDLTVTIRL